MTSGEIMGKMDFSLFVDGIFQIPFWDTDRENSI